jgi:hypothetical protein
MRNPESTGVQELQEFRMGNTESRIQKSECFADNTDRSELGTRNSELGTPQISPEKG